MDDSEENIRALEAFAKAEEKQLTDNLKSIISDVAKTGKYRIPWDLLKPLYLHTLGEVLNDFIESLPPKTPDGVNLIKVEELKELSVSLKQAFNKFTSAPFTIQRISELLINPRRHYKNTVKYFRGLEKNIFVISTVEPEPAEEKPAKRPKLEETSANVSPKPPSTAWFSELSANAPNAVETIVATPNSYSTEITDADEKKIEEDDAGTQLESQTVEPAKDTDDQMTPAEESIEQESIVDKTEDEPSEETTETTNTDEQMEDTQE